MNVNIKNLYYLLNKDFIIYIELKNTKKSCKKVFKTSLQDHNLQSIKCR